MLSSLLTSAADLSPLSRTPDLPLRISLGVEENNAGPVKGKFWVASPTMSYGTRWCRLKGTATRIVGIQTIADFRGNGEWSNGTRA